MWTVMWTGLGSIGYRLVTTLAVPFGLLRLLPPLSVRYPGAICGYVVLECMK